MLYNPHDLRYQKQVSLRKKHYLEIQANFFRSAIGFAFAVLSLESTRNFYSNVLVMTPAGHYKLGGGRIEAYPFRDSMLKLSLSLREV